MSSGAMKIALIGALILLAVATWANQNPVADAMFVFAAFVIGGVWAKQGGADE